MATRKRLLVSAQGKIVKSKRWMKETARKAVERTRTTMRTRERTTTDGNKPNEKEKNPDSALVCLLFLFLAMAARTISASAHVTRTCCGLVTVL